MVVQEHYQSCLCYFFDCYAKYLHCYFINQLRVSWKVLFIDDVLIKNIWREKISPKTFMFNYSFIFLQIYEICSQSNPSIQCRLACPPDQSVPANSQSHLPFSSHQSLAGILSLLLRAVLSTSQRFFSFL